MMKRVCSIFFLIACFSVIQGSAQFVYDGRGAGDLKWKQIEAKDYKLVYPDYYQKTALRVGGYMDSLIPYISYGMKKKILRLPVVLEAQNQLSNGMVVWAPKREELVPIAPPNTYAQPWLKQLSVHEFRHVVQISNLKCGLSKIATWVLGEAGLSLGMLFISRWQFEGDAVNAETQLAEFGRGLQPSYTIGYRALMGDGVFKKYSWDKIIAGSYKDFIPDKYEFGYQVMRATETYTRADIMGDLFNYVGRWPIFIFPYEVYLRHNYKTGYGAITKRAFNDLNHFWRPTFDEPNSYDYFTKASRSFTKYETPIAVGEGEVIVQKVDFDTPNWLIKIDSSGVEKRLVQLGSISSRPAYSDGVVYWTEYQADIFYEKRNYSVIKKLDTKAKRGKVKSFCSLESNYFVTPMGDGFATVKNDTLSNGYIQFYDSHFRKNGDLKFDLPTTLHGLAYDELSGAIAFIALDDRGMWLGSYRDGKVEVLREPSVVTISELRAQGGRLYYGSIASGKDEIHSFDLASRVEVRHTGSKYGAVQGSSDGENLYLSTFTSKGWVLGKQKAGRVIDTVAWSRKPVDRLNFPWVKWKIDTTKVNSIAMDSDTTSHKIKRFRRAGRWFNFHSWAPIATDLNGLMGEREIKLGFGASGFFQSTLGDMYGSVSLGAMQSRFWGLADFVYAQWPVQIGVRAEYGGGSQLVYGSSSAVEGLNDFFSIRVQASLPMNFARDAWRMSLVPRVSFTHYNAKVLDFSTQQFSTGLQMWDASVSWNVSKRTSYRALKPRLGYSLLLGVNGAFRGEFSTMYTALARGYFPGVLPNHSITLNASYQQQERASYHFAGKTLGVRGVMNNYAANNYSAITLDYTFPIFYPDFALIPHVFFIKRFTMNLFADGSKGRYFTTNNSTANLLYGSLGFDIGMDFTLIRTYDQSIKFSFAFPNDRGMFFSIGYNFGF